MLNEAYRRLAWARDGTLKQLIAEILSYQGSLPAGANPNLRRRTN